MQLTLMRACVTTAEAQLEKYGRQRHDHRFLIGIYLFIVAATSGYVDELEAAGRPGR